MKRERLLLVGLAALMGSCATPSGTKERAGREPAEAIPRVDTMVAGGLRTPEEVAAYNRVVAATVGAVVESGALPRDCADGTEVVVGDRKVRVAAPAGLRFDRLIPVAEGGKRQMRRSVEHAGVGVPMVARWEGTPERRKEHPFLSDAGYIFPVTVTVEPAVRAGGAEVLRVSRPADGATVRLGGRDQALAADYSAVGEYLIHEVEHAGKKLGMPGLGALRHSAEYLDKTGIIALEPPSADRIPLIFVHGLMSRPLTWHNAFNELGEDPVIRKRYQMYFFRYPTGVPVIYSASRFREGLATMDREMERIGNRAARGRMVLVGHSMGGLVSKMQVVESGDRFELALFGKPLPATGTGDKQAEALRPMLEFKPNPHVERVIFVCTPHRGSRLADGFIGKLGRKLISLPVQTLGTAGRAFGDVLSGDAGGTLARLKLNGVPSSIDNLSPESPFVQESIRLPLRRGLHIHSIVGNKKSLPLGDPDCGDGVVPYASAHLEGAESELVVKSGHGAQETPEAIAEIRRILLLHLESAPKK
jgi:pimeloyl-ACP methyl ester carboxylesterase